MTKSFTSVLLILHGILCFAQKDSILLDELYLEDGRLAHLDIGKDNQVLDRSVFDAYSGKSLSNLIQENTSIYVRKYGGEGQLSSITFRGTTPNHTLITWNGVDINSQTLGQSDLSSIPTFIFESAQVLAGGESTLFGGGNIGGSIVLNQSAQMEGANILVNQEFGSFGRHFSGIKSHAGNEKLALDFSVYRNKIENDFVVNYRGNNYTQNNARSVLQGWQSNLIYKLNQKNVVEAQIWYSDHDRQLQPTIGDLTNDDHLRDRNIRFHIGHHQFMNNAILKSSYLHLRDDQTYNRAVETNLIRNIAKVDFELFKYSNIILSGGMVGQITNTEVDNFSSDTSQWKVDQYLLAQIKPHPKLKLSIKAQKSNIQGLNVPFVFGGGAEYLAFKNDKSTIELGANASESFRAPTMNDLFWNPGGNPGLKPENGFHMELFIKANHRVGKQLITTKTNIYQTRIKNMIQWLPVAVEGTVQPVWSPENVQNVRIRGLEQVISYRRTGRMNLNVEMIYSYNQSKNLSSIAGNGLTVNKQLAYVPFHKYSANASIENSGWILGLNYAYTGKRYTEASNALFVNAFGVSNTTLSKSISHKSHVINMSFRVENLLDNDYQNYELRATPGRGYILKLTYNFSNTQLK